MIIYIPVPVAELFDKISILEIKLAEIKDAERHQHVERELKILLKVVEASGHTIFMNTDMYTDLKIVNKTLWCVCDSLRRFETSGNFDDEFIIQSRNEYKANDLRAAIKAKINLHFNSDIVEVKGYDNLSHEKSQHEHN
jgi:hypothetical protein